MSNLKISVRNFRVLDRLDWQPEGVCVLAGANGTGKTTTLDVLRFLGSMFSRGDEAAFQAVDSVAFRSHGSKPDMPVEFSVEMEDILWKLRLPMSGKALEVPYGEELYKDGNLVLQAEMSKDHWFLGSDRIVRDAQRCCAKVFWDRGTAQWMKPLADALKGIRTYEAYWLNKVRYPVSESGNDAFLHGTGRNLWSVLANWEASPLRYRGQFEWVLSELRRAFPGIIGVIRFDDHGLPEIYRPDMTDPAGALPPSRAADGLLTGLLHLTAVAGAPNGILLAFDELENHLHPHAIRSIIRAMRQQAEERDLTIILTTHSPIALNQFRDEEEQVYVLAHGDPDFDVPAPMTELHDEVWLAQSRLGSLYEHLDFAAPNFEPKQGANV